MITFKSSFILILLCLLLFPSILDPQGAMNSQRVYRKEIIAFLALWGISDKEKGEEFLVHLRNPSEFSRKYGEKP